MRVPSSSLVKGGLTCRGELPCVECEDWTGTQLDWYQAALDFDVGQRLGHNVRRPEDPASTTCSISKVGLEPLTTQNTHVSATVYLDAFFGSFGGRDVAAQSGSLTFDCPTTVGQTNPLAAVDASPPGISILPIDLRTPTPSAHIEILESDCRPYTYSLYITSDGNDVLGTHLQTLIRTRVRGDVGTQVSIRGGFFETKPSVSPPCTGDSPFGCFSCSGWTGGARNNQRAAGDPEINECVLYTSVGLERFELVTTGRVELSAQGRINESLSVPLHCPAATASVKALSATCDYVGGYQRRTVAAEVSGDRGATFQPWYREPKQGYPGEFAYFYYAITCNPFDPPCTGNEDCLICSGWTGVAPEYPLYSCPDGDSVRRASGDPPSAQCEYSQFFSTTAATSEPVFLQHVTADPPGSFGDRIEITCPPPP